VKVLLFRKNVTLLGITIRSTETSKKTVGAVSIKNVAVLKRGAWVTT